jgi:hypothetical protein
MPCLNKIHFYGANDSSAMKLPLRRTHVLREYAAAILP